MEDGSLTTTLLASLAAILLALYTLKALTGGTSRSDARAVHREAHNVLAQSTTVPSSSSAPPSLLRLPPVVPGGYWYFGHAFALAFNPVEFWKSCKAKFGSIFTCIVMGKPYTFLSDEEGPRFFLNVPPSCLEAQHQFEDPAQSFFPAYFFSNATSIAQNWMHTCLATFVKSDKFSAAVQECAESLDDYWDKLGSKGQVRLFDTMEEAAFRAATLVFGGHELQNEYYDEWKSLFVETDLLFGFMTGKTHVFDPRLWWRRSMVFNELERLFDKIIEKRLAAGSAVADDYLSHLIRIARLEDSTADPIDASLTQRVLARLYLSVSGAFVNSYLTSAWTTVHVLSSPRLAKEVCAEIEGSLKSSGVISGSAVEKQMPLLEACIKETVRLSTSGVIIRKVKTNLVYKSFIIPQGHTVATTAYFRHHDERLYPHPFTFNPHRYFPIPPAPTSFPAAATQPAPEPSVLNHAERRLKRTRITRDGSVIATASSDMGFSGLTMLGSTSNFSSLQSQGHQHRDEGRGTETRASVDADTASSSESEESANEDEEEAVSNDDQANGATKSHDNPVLSQSTESAHAVPQESTATATSAISSICESPYTIVALNGRLCACPGKNYTNVLSKLVMSVFFARFEVGLVGNAPVLPNNCLATATKPPNDCTVSYRSKEFGDD